MASCLGLSCVSHGLLPSQASFLPVLLPDALPLPSFSHPCLAVCQRRNTEQGASGLLVSFSTGYKPGILKHTGKKVKHTGKTNVTRDSIKPALPTGHGCSQGSSVFLQIQPYKTFHGNQQKGMHPPQLEILSRGNCLGSLS